MIVQLLTSFTGALGFCLVFHLRRRYMFAASLGGLLTCGVYLAAASIWSGILLPTLTAAAFAALYAEFLAWFMGAPATLFLIPALLIPLVPGRPLHIGLLPDWETGPEKSPVRFLDFICGTHSITFHPSSCILRMRSPSVISRTRALGMTYTAPPLSVFSVHPGRSISCGISTIAQNRANKKSKRC